MKKGDNRRGFTVIEVVLVLAIAGLIFLMIFIALPALQRQARDTQRREDMAKVISAIKKYQTNNRGALPKAENPHDAPDVWEEALAPYLPEGFVDPSGSPYGYNYVIDCVKEDCAELPQEMRNMENQVFQGETSYNGIVIVVGAKCDGSDAVKTANARKVAVVYKLEGGGKYCGET